MSCCTTLIQHLSSTNRLMTNIKVGELKEKIASNGGSIKFGDLTMSYKDGDDIDVKFADEVLLAWIPASMEADKDAAKNISVYNGDVLKNVPMLGQLAQFFGIEVGDIKPIEVAKEVVREDTQRERLAGKVEAYEKLLIGRAVTISA